MKKQWMFFLLPVLLGAAAFLLRLWQRCTGFEYDTGLPIPGTPAGPALAVFLLASAIGMVVLFRRLPGEKTSASALPQDFSANTPRLLVLPVTGVLLIAAAGLADLYEGFGLGNLIGQFLAAAGPDHTAVSTAVTSALGLSPTAQKLLGVLSLGSAAALFPTISACRRGGAFQGASLLLIPPVALVIRLVAAYRLDSVNPALSAYYVELLALTPADFDFEAGTVKINKSYQRLHGEDVITTPKTKKSNRTIKMPNFLCDEMRDYLGMLYGVKKKDRIFTVTKSYLHHEMDRGAKEAGVKRIRIHDLRHSHISLLIDMGFSAVAIADRVGHESIEITYRYAHLFPSKQTEMADKLDFERTGA